EALRLPSDAVGMMTLLVADLRHICRAGRLEHLLEWRSGSSRRDASGCTTAGDGVTAPGFMCGNTINGGLKVHGVTSVVTLAFGETNAGCAGGTINGGASFRNNPGAFVEVDAYTVNGPLLISGNAGGEVEGTTVHGPARCQPGIVNDGDDGPNTYHG